MNYFNGLTDDHKSPALVKAVKEVIISINDSGITYEKIAESASKSAGVNVISASLRAFIRRDSAKIQKNSETLRSLYNYIMDQRTLFDDLGIKEKLSEHWDVLNPGHEPVITDIEKEYILDKRLKEWLYITPDEKARFAKKVAGKYIMLRKTTDDADVVIKSKIEFNRIAKAGDMIIIKHECYDRDNLLRVSRGFLYTSVNNAFGIIRVEKGESMELLSIVEPQQDVFVKLKGMISGTTTQRLLFMARVCLIREEHFKFDLADRFKISDVKDKKLIELIRVLDDETSHSIKDG